VLLREGERQYATGDVTATEDSYRLSMVTTSQARAQQLLTEINSAEHALKEQAAPNRFELRILEAPALRLQALWLHHRAAPKSQSDLFLIVHGPHPRDSLVTVNNFIKLLSRVQSTKLKDWNPFDQSDPG
jgi:hypothetical protein